MPSFIHTKFKRFVFITKITFSIISPIKKKNNYFFSLYILKIINSEKQITFFIGIQKQI